MCVVSMIGDHFNDRWKELIPNQPLNPGISPGTGTFTWPAQPQISKQEFDDLKKEVEIMKALLIKAKIYDEKNNEPHCEMDEKVALLKKIAEMVGVDLSEIFNTPVKQQLND